MVHSFLGENNMQLYYQNETLFIDIEDELNEENIKYMKRKIFRIVDDYDINHIVLRNYPNNLNNKMILYQIKREYHKYYNGDFSIK